MGPVRSLLLVVLTLVAASACDTEALPRVTGAEARELVAGGAILLDVRTLGEYEDGHIDGATHIPLVELMRRSEELPRDVPIVVYCESGVRSSRATSMLRQRGHDARDLGGIGAWSD